MRRAYIALLCILVFGSLRQSGAQTPVNGATGNQNDGTTEISVQPAATKAARGPVLERVIPIAPLMEPGSSKLAPTIAIAGAHADYFGGPVISNVHVILVLYGSGSFLPNVTGAATPSLASFYTDITQSTFMDMLNEYSTTGVTAQDGSAGTNQTIGHGFFDGQFTINPSAANNGTTISDAQIQTELLNQVSAGNLPAPVFDGQGNNNTLYMIFFPPGKTITLGGISSCVSGGFCAYHNSTNGTFASHRLYYGVHPAVQPPSLCSQRCGGGSSLFDTVTNVTSHEFSEGITDPDVGPATTLSRPLAWVDPVNNEIGDICGGQEASVLINGTHYTVQREFSDLQADCVASPPVFQMAAALTLTTGQQFDIPVTLQNDLGTPLFAYTGTAHFTSTDPDAVLPADYTFTFADAGSHRFVATLKTGGTQSITMTDTKSAVITGKANYTVNAGAASGFNVVSPGNATSGTAVSVVVSAHTGVPPVPATGYTGTVHFTSSDSTAVLPADSMLTNGTGTFSVTFNTAGFQSLTATDTANSQISGTSVLVNVANASASPTVTTVVAGTNPSSFAQNVTYTAIVTQSGSPVNVGSVTFTADGLGASPNTSVDATGHAQATFSLPSGGPHTIFANFSGSGTAVPASSSGPLAVTVNPAPTTVAVNSTLTPSTFGQRISLTAQLTTPFFNGVDGGFVTFLDGGAPIAVVRALATSASFDDTSLGAGTHTITASYSGDANFSSATSAPFTQIVAAGPPLDYKLASDKNSVSLLAGQSAIFNITGSSVTGFSGFIKFSCGNLPAFTTCTFSPSSTIFVNPASPSVNTQLTIKTTGPNASLTPAGQRVREHSVYAGLWLAGPVCFGFVLLASSRRRKGAGAITLALISLIAVAAISSCGGGGGSTSVPPPPPQVTPSGTTAIMVSGTGTPSSGSPNPANPAQQISISLTVQ